MTGYGLKKIPPEIFKFIFQEQSRIKERIGTNTYSFECTVYKLLREHPRFEEFKKKLEQDKIL